MSPWEPNIKNMLTKQADNKNCPKKKEQAVNLKAAPQKSAHEWQSKAMVQQVSLQGDIDDESARLQDVEACGLTTDDKKE